MAVVHHRDCFGIVLDRHDAHHRAKAFVAHHAHVVGDVCQDLRRQIGTAVILVERRDMGDCTIGHRFGNLRAHFIGKADMRHWPKCRFRVQWITQLVCGDNFHRPSDKGVKVPLRHVNPFDPATALAGIEHRAVNQRFHRSVHVSVVTDIARVFAAQFQPDTGECACGGPFDGLTAAHRAGEVHKSKGPGRDQIRGCPVIQKHVLKHVLRHSGSMKRLRHPLTHQRRLAGMFQHHGIARNQGRCDGVDRGHIGIIPGGHDQHDTVRDTFDHAAKGVAVFNDDIGQGIPGDVCHIGRAFAEAAKFATIPDRAAHLVGQFRHDLVIHRADVGDSVLHQRNSLCQGPCGPCRLCRPRACHGGLGVLCGQNRAFSVNGSVDRGYTADHPQALSKPRAISQSVTTRSNSSCSHSAQRV